MFLCFQFMEPCVPIWNIMFLSSTYYGTLSSRIIWNIMFLCLSFYGTMCSHLDCTEHCVPFCFSIYRTMCSQRKHHSPLFNMLWNFVFAMLFGTSCFFYFCNLWNQVFPIWNIMFLCLMGYRTLCSHVIWNVMFLCLVINGTMCFLRETHSHLFLHLVCNRWNEMFLALTWVSSWKLMVIYFHIWLVIEGMPCSFD